MQRIMQVYAIRDTKAGYYHPPFYYNTNEEAKRWLQYTVQKVPDALPARFPEDIDLFHLGHLDLHTGVITSFETPMHIMKAIEAKTDQPNVQ